MNKNNTGGFSGKYPPGQRPKGKNSLQQKISPGIINITRFMDDVIKHDKTEYSSHALAEVVDG